MGVKYFKHPPLNLLPSREGKSPDCFAALAITRKSVSLRAPQGRGNLIPQHQIASSHRSSKRREKVCHCEPRRGVAISYHNTRLLRHSVPRNDTKAVVIASPARGVAIREAFSREHGVAVSEGATSDRGNLTTHLYISFRCPIRITRILSALSSI
jgi:hypothetical protein